MLSFLGILALLSSPLEAAPARRSTEVDPAKVGSRFWTTVSGLDDTGTMVKHNAYCPSGDGQAEGGRWRSRCAGKTDGSGWTPVFPLPPDNPPVLRFARVEGNPTRVAQHEGWLLRAEPAYTGFVDAYLLESPEGRDIYLPGWGYMVDGILQAPPGKHPGPHIALFRPAMDDAAWSEPLTITVYESDDVVDTTGYFPLVPGNWWEFDGSIWEFPDRRFRREDSKFKLKMKVAPKETICDLPVTPVLFFKDNDKGYWGAGTNRNLFWMLIDYSRMSPDWPQEFIWGIGEKHYTRNPREFESLGTGFEQQAAIRSDDFAKLPPYVIFPRRLRMGPFEGAWQHYYFTREEPEDCSWVGPRTRTGSNGWKLRYEFATVSTPRYSGRTIKIRFEEGEPRGPAYVEEWYFAKNQGIVQIDAFQKGEPWTMPKDSLPVQRRMRLVRSSVALQQRPRLQPLQR